VRKDLPDIVCTARSLGISTSIVTNGLRFADEEYCRTLLPTGAKIIFAFDGRDESVYAKLRGSAACYQQKLKALDNIQKYRKGKVTIMCVVAKGINDHLIADLFRFCHERAGMINALEFIPLTRTWEPGSIEADGSEITAIEDVEKIVADSVPGGDLEFLPAGLNPLKTLPDYLPMPRSTFSGAHPNCESATFLVSDGSGYVPIARFLRGKTLYQAVDELVRLDEELAARMERVRRGILGRLGLTRLVGRILCVRMMSAWFRRNVDLHKVFDRHPWCRMTRIGLGILAGHKAKHLIHANTRLQHILRVLVLPFEETRTLDTARLRRCPAAFVYEDPDTREVRTMPVCAWGLYKDDILRRTMQNYAPALASERVMAPSP